jgi:glutamine amidotransferase
MRGGGTINADGFGVGWFPEADPTPVRYRRATPIWSDPDLPGIAASIRATAVLAAVRSATVGMPVTAEAAAPFTDGPWLFSHNGVVAGWPASVTTIAARLPITDLLTMPAPTDAALIFVLIRSRLREGAGLRTAITATMTELIATAPESRLNLLLTDGETVVGTTYGHALSIRTGPGSVLVSSEPLDDDPAWRQVPDRSLLVADRSTVEISALPTEMRTS